MKKSHHLGAIALFCLISAVLYIFPLLLANKYYSDDILRYAAGEGWSMDGRPMATIIMRILSGGEKIKDLFPYTLIIGALLLVLSGYVISYVSELEKNKTYKLSALLLLVSPFMIENMSYRYDVLTIALSVLLVTLPFLWKNNSKTFLIAATTGVFISLLTYQASIVIYILTAILVLINYCFTEKAKTILHHIKIFSLPAIIGFILTKLTSKIFLLDYSGRDKTIFSSDDTLANLKSNWYGIHSLAGALLNSLHYSIFFIILLLLLLCVLILFFRKKEIPTVNKLFSIGLLFSVPVVVIIIPLMLQKTYIVPRIFVGLSFMVYAPLLFINKYAPKSGTLISIIYIIIALPAMASFSKYIKEQSEFQQFVIADIISKVDVHEKELVFDGTIEVSRNSEISLQNYFFFRYFYTRILGDNNFTLKEYFLIKSNHLYSPVFLEDNQRQKLLDNKFAIPILHKTNEYYIRGNEQSIIVDFNKSYVVTPVLLEDDVLKVIDISYNIDNLKLTDNNLYIRGWSFVTGYDSFVGNTELLLKNTTTQHFYRCKATTQERKDVSRHFGGKYDNSGFTLDIDITSLPKGEYTLGIFIENQHAKGYILTDQTFTKE